MSKRRTKIFISSSVLALSLMVISPALAATTSATSSISSKAGTHLKFSLKAPFAGGLHPGIAGPVTSIDGANLTLEGNDNTSYIVNASSAKVTKEGTTSSVADINVGDFIFVKGSVASTTVTATTIFDSVAAPKVSTSTGSRIKKVRGTRRGVVQNVSLGTVSALNGTSFNITLRSKTATTTLMVNTDSSTVFKMNGATTTIASLAIGQRVLVTGTKNATTSSIDLVKTVNILTGRKIAPKTK